MNRYLEIEVLDPNQEMAVLKCLREAGYFDADKNEPLKKFEAGVIEDSKRKIFPEIMYFQFTFSKRTILKEACQIMKERYPEIELKVKLTPPKHITEWN